MNVSKVFNESIRGAPIIVEYEEEGHRARINTSKSDFEYTGDIEKDLIKIGVYTRVDSSVEQEDGWIEIDLKPASSLELRDSNGVLKRRLVGNPTEGSVVTKQRNSNRYKSTIPTSVLSEVGIEEKSDLEIYIKIENQTLKIVAEPTPPSSHSVVVRKSSGGVFSFPSAIASSIGLDGHAVFWEAQGSVIVGDTTFDIEEIPTGAGETSVLEASISRKEQEVSQGGKDWVQEHFQTYIRSEHREVLGWGDSDLVDIRVASLDGNLCVVVDEDIREGLSSHSPCVKSVNAYAKSKGSEEGTQLNFYLPNALVYALKFDETPSIRWRVTDGKLVGS